MRLDQPPLGIGKIASIAQASAAMLRAGGRAPHRSLQNRCRNPLESHQSPIVQPHSATVPKQPLRTERKFTPDQPLADWFRGKFLTSSGRNRAWPVRSARPEAQEVAWTDRRLGRHHRRRRCRVTKVEHAVIDRSSCSTRRSRRASRRVIRRALRISIKHGRISALPDLVYSQLARRCPSP